MKISINVDNAVMNTIMTSNKSDVLEIARELGVDGVTSSNYEKVYNTLREVREEKDASPAGETIYRNNGANTTLDINIEDRYLVESIYLLFKIIKRVLPLASMLKAAWAFAKNSATLIKSDVGEFKEKFSIPESIKKYSVFGHKIGDRTVALVFIDDGYNKRFHEIRYHGDPIPSEILDYVLKELGGQKFINGLNFNLTRKAADVKIRQILRENDE